MDERQRRLCAGTEAGAVGFGGVATVARATGLAISTVRKGRDEARAGAKPSDVVRVRRSAGKRPFEEMHPEVWPALEKLVDPSTRGDPESPLRWTCKSTQILAGELLAQHGIRISDRTVADPDPMLCEQLTSEDLGALACPAQWRFWVASGRRVDELFQRRPDLGVHLLEWPLAGAASHADDVAGLRASPSFIPALPDRADRQPRRAGDRRDAAEADRSGLGTRPQSALPLIHGRLQQAPLLSDQLLGVVRRPHSRRRSRRGLRVDPSRSFSIEIRSRTAFAGPKRDPRNDREPVGDRRPPDRG